MPDPLTLYSAQTTLAFQINEKYYKGKHYVWCNPYASTLGAPQPNVAMPPSSNPIQLYKTYAADIANQDLHSAAILRNRTGLIAGAAVKLTLGIITQAAHDEIVAIANSAQLSMFKPILYVIPFIKIKKICQAVPPTSKAHPFSTEYLIEELKRSHFDIVEW